MKLAAVAILIFCLSGCVVVVNATMSERVERYRDVSGVGEVVMKARGTLHIVQGDDESLRIEGTKSAVESIRVRQRGDVLLIENRADFDIDLFPLIDWRYPGQVDIYLSIESIDAISLHGHGNVEMGNLNAENLHLGVQGHGEMKLGKVVSDKAYLTMDGHGDVRVQEILADRIETRLKGHGSVDLDFVDARYLSIDIQGHGRVRMSGHTEIQVVVIEGHGNYHARNLTSKEANITIVDHGSAGVWVTDSLTMDVARHGSIRIKGEPRVNNLSDEA